MHLWPLSLPAYGTVPGHTPCLQMEALQSIMAQHETAAAELQAANHQLALALQEAQQHTRSLEGQLADQRAALEEAAGVAAAQERRREQQLEELGSRLEEVLANRAALRADLQAAAAERQQLAEQAQAERQRLAGEAQREREAAAATSRQLAARVAELEGRKAVELRLTVVSHEAEWRAEAARVVALEARAGELQGQVAAYQQQERVEAARWVPQPAAACQPLVGSCGGDCAWGGWDPAVAAAGRHGLGF